MRVGLAVILAAGLGVLLASGASGQIPDPTQSWYIPQAGSTLTPAEGQAAYQYFRACPNNDGGASFPMQARIKIVVKNSSGFPMANISKTQIFALFNGGTIVQGFPLSAAPGCDPLFVPFSEIGADSIIGNCVYNSSPACPMTTKLFADADTDLNGETYITFTGSDPLPGDRDPNRKWGHFDAQIPIFVLGVALSGKETSNAGLGTYVLRIKNFDTVGGLTTALNQGERVNISDYNPVSASLYQSSSLSYWRDFDSSGIVDIADLNMLFWHLSHTCDSPNNP